MKDRGALIFHVGRMESLTEDIKKSKIEVRCRRHFVFLSRSELEVNSHHGQVNFDYFA